MAEDDPNEIPAPAEQPAKVESAKPEKAPAEQKAELKSQMIGLVTLLAVFGLLWGLVKVMPSLGEKLQTGISSVTSKGGDKKAEVEGEPVKLDEAASENPVVAPNSAASEPSPPTLAEVPIPALPSAPVAPVSPVAAEAPTDGSIPEEKVRTQILEALGGVEHGEVRHIAFSEDLSKMIAALKIMPKSGDSKLVEVLFERDDFGRYVSTEESPLDSPITIWK